MTSPVASQVADPQGRAERAIARAAAVATASAWTMLVLGGLSLAISITAPLSASFAISVAVVINGWIERRLSRRLARWEVNAARGLALNQLALGLEIAAYAGWQAGNFTTAELDHVLRRPLVARLLGLLDPAVASDLLRMLPAAVKALYWIVGAVAAAGCVATALYYGSRSRLVCALKTNPSPAHAVPPTDALP